MHNLEFGTLMASDDKTIKTDPAPKNEAPVKNETTEGADPSTAGTGETESAAPSGYSRGEGQKPVSQAYKDNWDLLFKKNKKKK